MKSPSVMIIATSNWLPAPYTLDLLPDHVDIWRIRLDQPKAVSQKALVMLSPDEHARAKKFLSAHKAREFTITRASLRYILGGILNEEPEKLHFGYEEDGKPFLVNHRLYFSVSHSHDLALIAVSQDREVGIDIEKIRTDIDHDGLAQRFFSAHEYQALNRIDDASRPAAFFSTWTRKEAIVKATGRGIASSLKAFDVSVDPEKPPRLLAVRWNDQNQAMWSLSSVETETNYSASLAVRDQHNASYHVRKWISDPDLL